MNGGLSRGLSRGLRGGCLGGYLAPEALQELLFAGPGLHLPAHLFTFKDFFSQSLLLLDLQSVLTRLLVLLLVLKQRIKKTYQFKAVFTWTGVFWWCLCLGIGLFGRVNVYTGVFLAVFWPRLPARVCFALVFGQV